MERVKQRRISAGLQVRKGGRECSSGFRSSWSSSFLDAQARGGPGRDRVRHGDRLPRRRPDPRPRRRSASGSTTSSTSVDAQARRPDSVGVDGRTVRRDRHASRCARAGRVRGPRSRTVPPAPRGSSGSLRSKALRAPACGGGCGSERGQAAVEFAMVVPLLCLIIVAILHFGKVMNYWLDLNHVASEGARKAAVNTFASDAEYDTFVCDRLETSELRTGGTTSIPNPSTISCLPAGRRGRRRPGDGVRSRPTTACRSSARRSRCAAARRCGSSSHADVCRRRSLRVSTDPEHRGSGRAGGRRHRRLRRDC